MNSKRCGRENRYLAWLCVVAFCNGGTLEGADLTGANFFEAKLAGANFSGADFYGADFAYANLSGANLSGTNLTGALLTGANLTDASLTGANLTDAKLYGVNLTRADLTHTNLTRANLTNTTISGADFTDTKLAGTDLTAVTRMINVIDECKFNLEFKTAGKPIFERDYLMNTEIHKFKNWYMAGYIDPRNRLHTFTLKYYKFSFEDEHDAIMAKMILE